MKYTLTDIAQAHARAILRHKLNNLTMTCDAIPVGNGTVHRSGRGFTYTENGQATVFRAYTVAAARDALIAWLQGERVAGSAAA
jgi:hypothetical protein